MIGNLKQEIRTVFEDTRSRFFWIYHSFSAVVIIAAMVIVFLETNQELYAAYNNIFNLFEYLITGIFTAEYLVYIWLAKKKRRYLTSFYGIVDLIAVLPTYLVFLGFPDVAFLRVMRAFRIFRLVRLFRLRRLMLLAHYHSGQRKLEREIIRLNLDIYFGALILLTLVFSIILFYLENGVPGSKILVIQDAIWMIMATITTVGFGDIVPVTFAGRLFVGLVMLVGIGFLGLAILIVGKIFQKTLFGEEIQEEFQELRESEEKFEKEHERLLKEENE